MSFSLDGKVAIVTGAASGIGAAISRRLRAAGAEVVDADLREPNTMGPKDKHVFRQTDCSRPDEVASLCEYAVSHFGALDIMVNNAGIAGAAPLDAWDASRSEGFWRLHILGVQSGIREAARRMNDGGAIVNLASITAVRGFVTWGEYAATKAGIISLTQTAAMEYGPVGLRVNCVAPGIIDTPMAMAEAPDMVERNARIFATLGRIGQPDEVAAAVQFFASPDANYITGQVLLVDGGWSVGPSIASFEMAAGQAEGE